MRLKHSLFVLPLAAMLAAGCGSTTIGPSDITVADLVGTWNITRFEYTKDGAPNTHVDLIADKGLTATAMVNANGTYTITETVAPITQTITGSFTVQNNTVVDTRTGLAAKNVAVTRSGNTLTYTDEDVTYDFDNNSGTPEENADLVMVWQKQ